MPPDTPLGIRLLHPQVLIRIVRLSLLVLVTILVGVAALSNRSIVPIGWWLLLVIAAVPGLLAPTHLRIAPFGWIAEVVVAALAASTPAAVGATLPYLVVPAISAAIFAGGAEATAVVGLAAVTLFGAGMYSGHADDPAYILPALEWIMISAVAALCGIWTRRYVTARATTVEPGYAQAIQLLTQLRTIARQLPSTLDPGSIADRLLDQLRQVAPVERGAVFTGSGGGRLEVLAQSGPDRIAWETSLDVDTPISEAWVSQQPQTTSRSLARVDHSGATPANAVSALVLPLVTGVRTVGIVVLETNATSAYPGSVVEAARKTASAAALRLETALLFDEVRGLATTEERQRLAREIHDGVAQELVMVGYGIDNAIADLPEDTDVAKGLRALRAEVTRVITELRLSLFELRSDVERHGGLGSAIAEFARTVGTSAGFRVHLSLDESTARLPAAVESELLRIAQEAVTNARKHANASNLWVSCEVDPPYVSIEVSDDGTGIGNTVADRHYGLSIMAERAERIRATLDIAPRDPRGTTVSVVLGKPARSR